MNTTIITSNKESFTQSTYNGISILTRDTDKFVNITKMMLSISHTRKRIDKLLSNGSWIEYYDEFCKQNNDKTSFMYKLKKGYDSKTQGWYFDPRLINYVAIWASPRYAITVGKIMDSINEKVHEKLNEQKLEDNTENATPIFNEITEEILQIRRMYKTKSNSCWGIRD